MPVPAAHTPPPDGRWKEFTQGASKAVPIFLGYIALSLAYGILARDAGLGIFDTVAMSVFVFAGAAQFIAVGMLAVGVDPFTIIFTTFLVNLRHILMGASLAPYLQGLGFSSLALLATGVTDETFALDSTEYARHPHHHFFMYGAHLTSYAGWVGGSILGAVSGSLVPGLDRLPLDFALPAMFISLLVLQVNDRLLLAAALLAGAVSVACVLLLPSNWNIMVATLLVATIASGWEKWKQ